MFLNIRYTSWHFVLALPLYLGILSLAFHIITVSGRIFHLSRRHVATEPGDGSENETSYRPSLRSTIRFNLGEQSSTLLSLRLVRLLCCLNLATLSYIHTSSPDFPRNQKTVGTPILEITDPNRGHTLFYVRENDRART